MQYCCPKDGSTNIQKKSIAYESGMSVGSVSGYDTKGNSISGTSTHQTLLSRQCAPPKKKIWISVWGLLTSMVFWPLFIIFLIVINQSYDVFDTVDAMAAAMLFGLIFTFFIIVIALVIQIILIVVYANKASKYNNEVWPKLFQRWNQEWICLTCGCVFELNT